MTAALSATHYRVGDDLAEPGTPLPETFARQIGRAFNDAGAGTATMHNTAEDLDVFQFDGDDLVAIDLYDERLAVFIVESPAKVVVRSGKGNLQTTLPGRTHHALLERFCVMPYGGPDRLPKQTDRWWDWTSPVGFDDSGWDDAYDVGYVAVAKVYWPIPIADNMPDQYPGPNPVQLIWGPSAAAWAGDTSGTPGGNPSRWSTAFAAPGEVYFRKQFTDSYPKGLKLRFLLADNAATDYINGVAIGSAGSTGDPLSSGYESVTPEQLKLPPGEYLYAAVVSNFPPAGGPNPAALAVFYAVGGYPPLPIFQSDDLSGWKVLETADGPPGMTMGQKWNILLDEAQDEGFLPYITRGFDDVYDFDGNPWPVVNASSRVGTDYLTELRQDAATYLDWDLDPESYELRLWVKGQKDASPGVSIVVNENLTDLVHELDTWRADSLLGDYQGGWALREVENPSRRALLALGSDIDPGEVGRKLDGELNTFSSERRRIPLTYQPGDGTWPGLDFDVGDTIAVTDIEGIDTTDVIVQNWTVLDHEKTGRALATIVVGDEGTYAE